MLGQIGLRRHCLRQRVSKLADVIAGRYTMPGQHGVHDLTRSEHIRLECGERSTQDVLIDLGDAKQESGIEHAACKTEIVVLRHQHAMRDASLLLPKQRFRRALRACPN